MPIVVILLSSSKTFFQNLKLILLHLLVILFTGISSFLFICVGIGSLFIASASIIAAVFFCFPSNNESSGPLSTQVVNLSRFHAVSVLAVLQKDKHYC